MTFAFMGRVRMEKIDKAIEILFGKKPEDYPRTEYFDNVGYCINCGLYHKIQSIERAIYTKSMKKSRELFLLILLRGLARKIDIDCPCGSDVGIYDMDLENFVAWDLTEKTLSVSVEKSE